MAPQPTGRLVRKDDGIYVVLDRIVRARIEEVWACFTRSSYLSRWIGETTGRPSTGAVKFRMNAEGDDATWEDVAILLCDAPHRLHLDVGSAAGSRRIFVHLTESSGHTTITFGTLVHTAAESADDGASWDYYLDRMVAVHDGKTLPRWDDYHPGFLDHYQTLYRELDHDMKTEHGATLRTGTTG